MDRINSQMCHHRKQHRRQDDDCCKCLKEGADDQQQHKDREQHEDPVIRNAKHELRQAERDTFQRDDPAKGHRRTDDHQHSRDQ